MSSDDTKNTTKIEFKKHRAKPLRKRKDSGEGDTEEDVNIRYEL